MGIGACETCGSGHHYGYGSFNHDCPECVATELDRLREENTWLRAWRSAACEVFRGLEWSDSNDRADYCPRCGHERHGGHDKDCGLAYLLKEATVR